MGSSDSGERERSEWAPVIPVKEGTRCVWRTGCTSNRAKLGSGMRGWDLKAMKAPVVRAACRGGSDPSASSFPAPLKKTSGRCRLTGSRGDCYSGVQVLRTNIAKTGKELGPSVGHRELHTLFLLAAGRKLQPLQMAPLPFRTKHPRHQLSPGADGVVPRLTSHSALLAGRGTGTSSWKSGAPEH